MNDIGILGAGAFGTALAIALARDGRRVALWGRDAGTMRDMAVARENTRRLPHHALPPGLDATHDLAAACAAPTILLAVPTQQLGVFAAAHAPDMDGKALVVCCKGIDMSTGLGPVEAVASATPKADVAILSGPSFAVDIAAGLPTALTIAAAEATVAHVLQERLSTATLRLYRTTDVAGVETGGALKNVVAIACGIAIGAGLGESARAALMTRGYAEMLRFALARGARAETLAGLSGLGDLALTSTSEKSRNFAYGLELGRMGKATRKATTEGIETARAVAGLAERLGLDMPIARTVAQVVSGETSVREAVSALMSRPLRPE